MQLPSTDGFCGDNEYDRAHPRHNDQHAAGDVDCDQVVRELPLEYKLNLQTAVFPWKYIAFIFVTFLPCLKDMCGSNWFQCTVFTYCLQLL